MRAYWRLGFPGWKVAAHLGLPIKIKIDVCRDEQANVYFATFDDIGLAVESISLDGLMTEIHSALPELLLLVHSPAKNPKADIRFPANLAVV